MPKEIRDAIKDGDEAAIQAALKSGDFYRKVSTEVKAINREAHEITFAITTDTLDRDGERVMPKAFESTLKNYLDNPVVLWAHDPRQPVVAQMVSHKISDTEFLATDRFAVKEYEFAAQLWALYSAEPTPFMRATSVGFIPIETSHEKEDMLPNQRGVTFQEAELLEHSLVPVPSNRLALAKMYPIIKSQIDPLFKDYLDELMDTAEDEYKIGTWVRWIAGEEACQGMIEDETTKSIFVRLANDGDNYKAYGGESHTSLPRAFFKNIELEAIAKETDGNKDMINVGGVPLVPIIGDTLRFQDDKDGFPTWQPIELADPSDTEVKKITRFIDLPMAGSSMRWSWSTNTQNAVLADSNWGRYKRAHIFFDPDDDENKSGYKLPFAKMINGQLRAVPRGIFAAMGAVNGARGGVDIPEAERRAAYNHLARYYDKLDRDAPDFKKDSELGETKSSDLPEKFFRGTVDGSWERDERDIQQALVEYKNNVLGFGDWEWLIPFGTFPKHVLAWADEHDQVYMIDWKRGKGREIIFSNPRFVEADFSGVGEVVDVEEMAIELEDESIKDEETEIIFDDETLAQLQTALETVQQAQRDLRV